MSNMESSNKISRYQILSYQQVQRLTDVMETCVPIHGAGNFPTLEICPSVLVQTVKERIERHGIAVRAIRLNGSAATHVLSGSTVPTYKDLDLIFQICPNPQSKSLEREDLFVEGGNANLKLQEGPAGGEDGGYASSESLSSYPSSPCHPCPRKGPKHPDEDLFQPYHRSRDSYWEQIKDTVVEILLDYLPPGVIRERICNLMLTNAYVQKKVKVVNGTDEWSLISLNNNTGRNLELKFVQSMNRQYEFSVDSFQIELRSFLDFRSTSLLVPPPKIQLSHRFYPTIVAESVYGDVTAALRHLRHRRICTFRPEEIRGGGLLRYCNLRVRGYRPGDCDEQGRDVKIKSAGLCLDSSDADLVGSMEQHMCSRFFIDFSSIQCQSKKLINYLQNRFRGEDDLKLEYLITLRSVIASRTVCLMKHELQMILDFISHLIRHTLATNISRSNTAFTSDYYHLDSSPDFLVPHCYITTMVAPSSDRSSPMSICDQQSARSSPEPFSRPSSTPPTDNYHIPSSSCPCCYGNNFSCPQQSNPYVMMPYQHLYPAPHLPPIFLPPPHGDNLCYDVTPAVDATIVEN